MIVGHSQVPHFSNEIVMDYNKEALIEDNLTDDDVSNNNRSQNINPGNSFISFIQVDEERKIFGHMISSKDKLYD
jgi:hypothetical protein